MCFFMSSFNLGFQNQNKSEENFCAPNQMIFNNNIYSIKYVKKIYRNAFAIMFRNINKI